MPLPQAVGEPETEGDLLRDTVTLTVGLVLTDTVLGAVVGMALTLSELEGLTEML